MKNIIWSGLVAVTMLTAFKWDVEPNPILGRWELNSVFQGQPFSFLVVFRATGSYDGFLNKKAFVSGKYQMSHDTLFISDPICNIDYKGTYKVKFFAQDSIKFHVIQDTCQGRREGVNNLVYKKVKAVAK